MTSDLSASNIRVAVITSNFWPEATGIPQTVTEFSRYLAARGIEVKVATSMPYYPQWRIWPKYRRRLWFTEQDGAVTVYRSWHYARPTPSTLTRLLHEATLSFLALPNILRSIRRADVAFVISPALLYAFTGLIVARMAGVRRVLVVKDVMPDAAIELGMLRNRVLIAVSRWLARRVYALADEIHTLGEGMRRRILRDAKGTSQVRIVPDTVDADELCPVTPGANEFRRRFVPNGAFAVLHTGNIGKKQDLGLLVRAANRLRDDVGVRFYVFGDGAVKDEFLRSCRELDLKNVSHYPLQERWMLRHMLSGADVVLVSQLPEVVDSVVPSKLITSLAAGAMIVAACAPESEAAKLIEASDGGIVIPAGSDAALADVITRIRRGEVDVRGYRERARRFASGKFDRNAVYGPVADALISGLARSNPENGTFAEARSLLSTRGIKR